MEATFVVSDRGVVNTSRYRIGIPAKYLERAGHTIKVIHQDELGGQSSISEVVLVEREVTPEKIEALRSMGARRIIVTFDDAYHIIPPVSPAHDYWKGQMRRIDAFRSALNMCDLSIVPSLSLASYYGAKYVPNYHDPELWPTTHLSTDLSLPVMVGWGGSSSHVKTWENAEIVAGIKAAQEETGFDLRVYGNAADDALFGTGIKFKSIEWLPFDEWPWKVSELDIMLAPLSGEYDLFRSNLKLIEAGLAHIPFVATNDGEYKGAPGGMLVPNDRRSWCRALVHLVKSEHTREVLGRTGETWAQRFLMPARVEEYQYILWPDYKAEEKK